MKRRLTLSIDDAAIDRARRYAELHGTTVSVLVDWFPGHLPSDEVDAAKLTPTVRRLLGIAGATDGVTGHRAHLVQKYS